MTPVFLFSPPRSGSTLVMRMLMNSPRVCFGGETETVLWKTKDITEVRNKIEKKNPSAFKGIDTVLRDVNSHPAWVQSGTEKSVNEGARKMLEGWAGANENDHDFWGWKEISIGYKGSTGMFEWIERVMPDAKMIFLFRNQIKTLSSLLAKRTWFDWYGKCPSSMERTLATQTQTLLRYSRKSRNENAHIIYHEDVIKEEFPKKFLAQTGIEIPQSVWQEQVNIKPAGA
jgi:hypothetical protein